MGGGGDSEVVEGGGGVFDVSSDWRSEVGAGAEDAAMVLDGATELVVAAELVSAESVAEVSVPKCSPSGTGMGKSLGSQPGTSQSSSSSSSSSSPPSSSSASSSALAGGDGGTGVLEGFEASEGVASMIGGKIGRRTVNFGMTVAGGFSSGKVIGLGGSMTGIGVILSSGLLIVTHEKDTMSVVIGGNVIV